MKFVAIVLLAASPIWSFVIEFAYIRQEERVILEEQDPQLILVEATDFMGLQHFSVPIRENVMGVFTCPDSKVAFAHEVELAEVEALAARTLLADAEPQRGHSEHPAGAPLLVH